MRIRITKLAMGLLGMSAIVGGILWALRLPVPEIPFAKPFKELDTPWILTGCESIEYVVRLDYQKGQPGRLGRRLKIQMSDETTHTDIPLTEMHGRMNSDQWSGEILGHFRAVCGHQYLICVDADDAKALARFDHRLVVDFTDAERVNRMFGRHK
jgi:hypothetical protein